MNLSMIWQKTVNERTYRRHTYTHAFEMLSESKEGHFDFISIPFQRIIIMGAVNARTTLFLFEC